MEDGTEQSEQTLSYLLELCHRYSRLPQICDGIFTVLLLLLCCVLYMFMEGICGCD